MMMRANILGVVFVLFASVSMPASAGQDMEEMMRMVKALKERVEQLEYQLAQQSHKVEQVTAATERARSEQVQETAQRLAKLEESKETGSRFGGIDFHGVVEVEATSGDDHTGTDGSDITLATVELGFDFTVFDDWVTGTFMSLYEDDDTEDWTVDEAHFTIGNTEKFPIYLTAGRMYVPFGKFETNMVSDTLALEIGETQEAAVLVGFEKNNFYGSAYVFNGDLDEAGDDEIENYGFNIGYAMEGENSLLDIGLDWTNSLSDADLFEDYIASPIKDYVAGYSVHGIYRTGPWSFMGEYLSASDNFLETELSWKGKGAEPEAWNLEVGYDFEAFGGRESNIAIGIQGTREAVALELPEDKFLVGMSTILYENTSLALEYSHADDYSVSDGGSGTDGDTLTLQVAVEF